MVWNNTDYNRIPLDIQKLTGISTCVTSHLALHIIATTIVLFNNMLFETPFKVLEYLSLITILIYSKILNSKMCFDFDALLCDLDNYGL